MLCFFPLENIHIYIHFLKSLIFMKELVIESGLSKCQLFSFFFVSLGQKHLLTVVLTRMLVAGYAVFAVCTIISSTNSFMDKMCDSCA